MPLKSHFVGAVCQDAPHQDVATFYVMDGDLAIRAICDSLRPLLLEVAR